MLVQQLLLLVVEQLLNPIPSSNHVSKKSLEEDEVTHILSRFFYFSRFHPNHFRNTISWESFMKNDGVRSCMIELQRFSLCKIDVDPIHRVLMFLPCCLQVLCKTRCIQVDRIRILMFFLHRIHKQKNTVCLLLNFCPPGINPEYMMECKLIAHPT